MSVKLFDSEFKMMKLIWENEPVNSTELMKLCDRDYHWKKSTTYTIIKKLKMKNYIESNNAVITALLSKDEASCSEASGLLEKYFNNNVPSFVASFLKDKKLTNEEVKEIMNIIQGEEDESNI